MAWPPSGARCQSIGADATINDSTQDLREAVKLLTNGKGPDVIYDPVGGDLAEPAFRSIAWRGRYLVVGVRRRKHSRAAAEPDAAQGRIHRRRVPGRLWNEPKANASAMTELAQWYAQGKIKPAIDRTLSMAELKQAYARMGSRGVMGKLVMPN